MHIRCDTDGCSARIELEPDELGRDVTQYVAGEVAERSGWFVKHGTARDYHHCPQHRNRHDG